MGISRRAARAVTASLVVVLASTTLPPTQAALPDEARTVTVTGRLVAAGEDELVYALARDNGSLVPITGDLDGLVGDRVTVRLRGSEAATLVSSTGVAEAAAVEHRVFVARPTNVGAFTLTDSQLLAEVSTVASYWVDEADGEITSFDLPDSPSDTAQFKTYSTGASGSTVCAMSGGSFFSQVAEAAALFPGADFFGAGATDLLVVMTPDQGCDTGTVGIGTVGSSYTGGGASINRAEPDILQGVLAHETGHNFGLAHSNVGTRPYLDVYNVMAFALSGVNQLTALSTAYRVGTGLDDPGEVETLVIPDVDAPATLVRTLGPRAETTGLRALEVTVPDSDSTYYIEYRAGLGQDAGSAYALTRTIAGVYQFRPGVVVEEIYDDDAGVGVSLVTSSPGTRVATTTGQTWTSPSGTVSFTVASVTASGAEVTLTYSPPVPFDTAPAISLASEPRAGQPVTIATEGAWTPQPESTDVTWLLDDVPIPGATTSTLTPTAAMAGRALSVRMTAQAPGRVPSEVTAAPRTVLPPVPAPPTPTLLGAVPTIEGDARVGTLLTARVGAWSPGATLAYQWYADNVAVPGASTTTYTPGPAQQGAVLKLLVTGRLGPQSLTRSSAGTRPVARGQLTPLVPKIRGKAVVGKRLKVRPGAWPAGAKLAYQWVVGGKAVAKMGTRKTLAVTRSMRGKKVTVRVTASRPGYTSLTLTSDPTKRVAGR